MNIEKAALTCKEERNGHSFYRVSVEKWHIVNAFYGLVSWKIL